MSDPIELTGKEQTLAALAVQRATGLGKRHHGVVNEVVSAINAARQPAPEDDLPRDFTEMASLSVETEEATRVVYRVWNLWDTNGELIHSQSVSYPYDADSGAINDKYRKLCDALYDYLKEDV